MKIKKQKSLFIGISLVLLILSISFAYAERTGNENIESQSISPLSMGILTNDLNSVLTPEDLANTIVGAGVTISDVSFTGANAAAGNFSGGTGIIGFESGIILSNGNISNVIGPNVDGAITQNNSLPGDLDLDTLIPGYTTYDATVLEFNFTPAYSEITIEYVFASDEYNEWVHSPFNDVFAFFVNGQNIALVPGTTTPVSINNIKNGTPYGTPPMNNSEYYINNDLYDGGATINTEMDGLTVVLTATAEVNPNEVNRIKLAIADAGDGILDANVFIRAESFGMPHIVEKDFRHTDVNFTNESGAELGTILDTNLTGAYNVTYVTTKNGIVKSTNPGQIYGVINITGKGVTNVSINDTFGEQFLVNPEQLGGGVEVIRVNSTTGLAEVLTNTSNVTSADVNNTKRQVTLVINLTSPLEDDEHLMIYVKYKTALKHTELEDLDPFVNRAEVIVEGVFGIREAIINFLEK